MKEGALHISVLRGSKANARTKKTIECKQVHILIWLCMTWVTVWKNRNINSIWISQLYYYVSIQVCRFLGKLASQPLVRVFTTTVDRVAVSSLFRVFSALKVLKRTSLFLATYYQLVSQLYHKKIYVLEHLTWSNKIGLSSHLSQLTCLVTCDDVKTFRILNLLTAGSCWFPQAPTPLSLGVVLCHLRPPLDSK